MPNLKRKAYRGAGMEGPVLRKKLTVLGFRIIFTPLLFRADIRGAGRREPSSLPLVGHTEFGDLKFPARECLLMVQVCLAPGRNADGPCCNEPPIP